jgi:2-keto-4-pentenoate hydratase/2-oxohepta-3-ene-1,7-dioic acid hydratase in catechol pathway
MKFCRFQPAEFVAGLPGRTERQAMPEIFSGILEGESVREIVGAFPGEWRRGVREWPLEDVRLLPPVSPGKIVCVGRNYAEHAAELGNEVPKEPLLFLKPPSTVIGPEEPIVYPAISKRVDYEGELAAVIGRRCRNLGTDGRAAEYIAGYTCLNDVTARDIQKADAQFTRGKSFDTFCPIGPVIECEFQIEEATLETWLNGERKQHGRIAEMIFSVDVLVRWITQVMTLEPGDVVALGTPPGVGSVRPGDVVEVRVSGIGHLRNSVVES